MGRAKSIPDHATPLPWAPRGLSRIAAANHISVSTTMWDTMVRDGRMPQPKIIGSRVVWDRVQVEAYFEALPERGTALGTETDDEILAKLG